MSLVPIRYHIHLTATECHLPYGITQCYLPPDTSEHTLPSPHCVSELSVELSVDISDLHLFVMSHCLYDIMSALNVYKYVLHM